MATVKLFLCGDVMTGRGIDQILPHPGDPRLHESYVRTALRYVELAEAVAGNIDRPVGFAYIWGDALEELDHRRPAARIVNLETAVTCSGDPWPAKGIHYRMHPANLPALTAAKIDCCVLANNHVLDFGREGLAETLATLSAAGIGTSGAGQNSGQASAPACIEVGGNRRILVIALATEDSGVPREWAATADRSGVNLLPSLSSAGVSAVAHAIDAQRRRGDLIVVSLHWGSNWGFGVSREQREFAHSLIDVAGADLVHGHSAHHAKGIEVHGGKLILYGCGDFVNDYEGIGGYESFRADLAVMYFPELDTNGRLLRLAMAPLQRHRLRLIRAQSSDAKWLADCLTLASREFGTRVILAPDGELRLHWN